MAEDPTPPEPTAAQAAATMRSRPFLALLVVAAVVGVIVSLAAWCYLEGVFQIQQELFQHLPHALGYEQRPPLWWSLPVLAVGALIVALILVGLGEFLSRLLHFSTGSLSVAGGIILFIIALAMVLGSAEPDGNQAIPGRDPMRIAVFPLAMPFSDKCGSLAAHPTCGERRAVDPVRR